MHQFLWEKMNRGNIVLYFVGEKPVFDFKVKNHVEIGAALGIIDEERAAKISGARFVFLKNEAVLLQFALAICFGYPCGKGVFLPYSACPCKRKGNVRHRIFPC